MKHRSLICLLLTLLALLISCHRQGDLPAATIDIHGADYGKDFKLNDPNGNSRTLVDFHGDVVLLFFGFTQCPDVCPTALSRAAEVRKLLKDDASRLQVIFVTVDPERDTPAVLKSYTAAFDSSFLGLSSDTETTRKTADAFHIFYAKVPTGNSYTLDHSAISYLLDPAGKLRFAVRPDATAEEVTRDVRILLNDNFF